MLILALLAGGAVAVATALAVLLWRDRRAGAARAEATAREALDLADRVTAAEAGQSWLQRALDEATDAVVVVDRRGDEVVRNEAARRLAGARTGEALADDALAELLRDATDGRQGERELQLFGPPRRVLHLRAVPLLSEGDIVGAVAFARDVTEARRADRARRDFVANVSHELRTPIGALSLLAETLAAGHDPATVRDLADRVVREADRLARIVDDLLDLSEIESEERRSRSRVGLRDLLRETVEAVSEPARVAGVTVDLADAIPDVELVCDRRQLRSAIVNLLDNAVKYSSAGGRVEVAARAVDQSVAIAVSDQGIGIPARELERIFERFYRVDRARARDTGGTGLGLAIVRHVAQAHGGTVSVRSREGEGSTFTLSLPVAEPRAETDAVRHR
jgi:two-component system sensor histidine kinase SenX3